MDSIIMIVKEKPELKQPILVEGLPGVGNVGKLAAEHLVEQLGAVKFADIYSKFFPPQVLADDNGVIRLVSNGLYYVKKEGMQDLIILVGDYQGLTPDGQYDLSDFILSVCKEYDVKRIYTLGGYGVGRMIEKPRVLGAVTHEPLIGEMKEKGVEFSKGEPGSGIVGASGLLLGLGQIKGYEAVCLMGETSGYFVDPKGAESVLRVLSNILGVDVNYSALQEKAQQIDMIANKLKEQDEPVAPKREDLGYIG
ncbi:MAG TPA: proteasome assembly chaperone family protein [Methanomassiliicoccales archaeon]|nr:proteasome assembly chaperone family protein [Methanomassiliicoccales archaeon]